MLKQILKKITPSVHEASNGLTKKEETQALGDIYDGSSNHGKVTK